MGETVKGSFESVIDFGSGGVNRCRQYRFDFEDLTSQTFLLSLLNSASLWSFCLLVTVRV